MPVAFLDDVLAHRAPVLWAGSNIWQLDARANARVDDEGNGVTFAQEYGWWYSTFDTTPINHVTYKGASLDRNPENMTGILGMNIAYPDQVTVLWTVNRAVGRRRKPKAKGRGVGTIALKIGVRLPGLAR